MEQFAKLSRMLTDKGIKPSIPRINILAYLLACHGHPSAEEIDRALKEKALSLSKATIYNTLTLFTQKGLVRVLTLDHGDTRYDILVPDHGHFLCERCGSIEDFAVAPDEFPIGRLSNCRVSQRDLIYRGVCQTCLCKSKEKEDASWKEKESAR